MNLLFEVNGLSKRFGRIAALSDVSFGVRAGEVLGLIGPNGAGKSTLFECLAGVLPSDSGAVSAGGRPIESRDRSSLLFMFPTASPPGRRSLCAGRSISPSVSSEAVRRSATK